jgi:general secretion pathway protein J
MMRTARESQGRVARGTRASARSGFTLIEVLVALSLLAFGLALTFGALRGATRSSERAGLTAQRDERLRAVQGFMRRQLSMALPIAFEFDQGSGEATLFRASADKVEFVANMPGYLSRGGPYLQTLSVVHGEHGLQLQFGSQLLSTEGPLKDERAPEILLDGLSEAKFWYRGLDENGRPGSWQTSWSQSSQLPPLVRLSVRFEDVSKHWPDLVVPLRLASPNTGMPTEVQPADLRAN